MSTEDTTATPDGRSPATDPATPPEPFRLTLDIPARIAQELRLLVTAGVHLSLEEALRDALVDAWRFQRASYHRIRLDVGDGADDEGDEAGSGRDVAPADASDEG